MCVCVCVCVCVLGQAEEQLVAARAAKTGDEHLRQVGDLTFMRNV